MKTAMQILIDEMTEYLTLSESKEVREVLMILKASAIRKHWKEEKEQMIDFYTWMRMNDKSEQYFHYSDEDMLTEYLNQNK